jgi:hypothetical protein
VDAIPSDPEATLVITGKNDLVGGDNTVSIVVTAADKSTRTYQVNVRVLVLSSDVSLSSLKVNGSSYVGPVSVPFGVRSVDVVAVTSEPAASYVVLGNGVLRTGENNVVVRVTAVNGDVRDYVVAVTVLKSSNADLAVLTVNGQNALAGGVVVVPARTAVALVKAAPADSGASVSVSGTALVAGQNNVVSVVVTAADGVTTNKVDVTVFVTPLSEDSTLKSLENLKLKNRQRRMNLARECNLFGWEVIKRKLR